MKYDFTVPAPVRAAAGTQSTPVRISMPDPQGSAPDVERTVLYGTDMRKTRIPGETLSGGCQVAFRDEQGRMFGLDEELLSKHLLLLGGIGSGKTNVFNFIIESLQKRLTRQDVILIFDTKGDSYI